MKTAMQEIIDFIESQEYNFLNKEQLESCNKIKEKAEQLLEMEKQQSDNFAIEFADWCNYEYTKLHSVWCPIFGDQRDNSKWKNTEELLEIFKNK